VNLSFQRCLRWACLLGALAVSGAMAGWAYASDEPTLPAGFVAALKGHTETIYTVAFSPDGRCLLTGSFDRTLKLWNATTGKELKTLDGPQGHQQLVLSAAFSPDGRSIASGGSDNTAKIWENPVLDPLRPITRFGRVFIFAGSFGKDLLLVKPDTAVPAKNLPHANLVDAVAFNPAGSQLATGGHDGTVRIWNVGTGQQLREIKAHTTPAVSPVYCVAWTPDGKQVLSGSLDRTMKLWDANSGTVVREFKGYKEKEFEKGHRDGVFCSAISPDGKRIVSGSSDRTIKLWNLADGSVIRDFALPGTGAAGTTGTLSPLSYSMAHPGWVYSLRITSDGKFLVSAGSAPRNHGFLAVWNMADGKLLHGQELPLGPFYSLAVSPDAKFIALACGPRDRQSPESTGYILKMPSPDGKVVSQAAK
jgi:WD40 repeat protein